MRCEYCEKNGIMITYTDTDVAFEELDTAMSILISNDGSILHNNFSEDKDKTQRFLDDFYRIYPTVVTSDFLIRWEMQSDASICQI